MAVALHILVQCAVILRVLLRPHRDPASRIAWIAVVLAVPVIGMIAYLLLGETNIGRRRVANIREVLRALPEAGAMQAGDAALGIADRHRPLFRVGQSISGYAPVGGNAARLFSDSDATITALVADIDAATDHVHLLFYIWLDDNNGTQVAEALRRAASRGVVCRAMVDDVGSRAFVRGPHWAAMRAAGVQVARALPVGFAPLRALFGRIDLRNHRKIVVIDGGISYCGSQNCADPAFRVKPAFAPWVDAVMRFEGPVARQNQHLFATDWMSWTGEDLGALLAGDPPPARGEAIAQVVASGPTLRYSAMPEMFANLIYAARRELAITTPYYVPDDSLQSALRAAAHRGVATTLILPARNDNWAVAAASRSYYAELLAAGVRIHEYVGGLLHTKSLTLDGEVTLIGSANMDRRSFDLNYENNILLVDAAATAAMRALQDSYVARSRAVRAEDVAAWPMHRRLWNNLAAVLSPVL
jgi:cardiolipin synthase